MDFFRKQTLDVVFTQKKRLFGLGDDVEGEDEEESEDE